MTTDSHSFVSIANEQHKIKSTLVPERQDNATNLANILKATLDLPVQRRIELTRERGGASVWLSALPLKAQGFHLHKSAFRDAVYLRYGWPLLNSPDSYICGRPFTIDHVLSCPRGGFTIVHHNEIRDMTATFLSDIGSNVTTDQSDLGKFPSVPVFAWAPSTTKWRNISSPNR